MSKHARMMSLAALAALAMMLSTADTQAQVDDTDLRMLTEQAQADGWTFTVGPTSVTHKPLEAICNLQEPVDWQATARFRPPVPPETGAVVPPTSWDWRTLEGCTPIRNQASCGSCWAFGTVAALEGAIMIRDGLTKDLSEQYLVSCNQSGWSCSGGWFAHDYHWDTPGADGGIGAVLESAKPYTATNQACSGPLAHPYTLNSWYYVSSSGGVAPTTAIKQAIMLYGPVSVAVHVNNAFQAYRTGVFNSCVNATVNHAVALVGWNDAQQAWILRNSWGTGWGESGYMRIKYGCSRVGYAACYVDYGAEGNPGARLLSPENYTILGGPSAEFTWESTEGATEYWLSIGNALGKANLYSASQGTNTSATIGLLPTNNKPLYAKLYTRIGGQWFARPYVFTAANIPNEAAAITSPENGSTLEGSSATFTWSAGSGAQEYKLWIGTSAGISNLYNKSQGLNRSVTVSNLPCNGKLLYVRLWTRVNNVTWLRNNYTYTAASVAQEAAAITSHENGATLESSSVTFTWDEGVGATEYYLWVGTAAKTKNLVERVMGKARTLTLNGLPTNGNNIYVRLMSKINGVWQYGDTSYVTPNLTRGAAEITSPASGATLDSESATFEWTAGVGATQYSLMIGTAVGGGNLYNKAQGMAQSVTISTLPTNGQPLYVRLKSRIAGVWQAKDYVYTAATITAAAAEITAPVAGSLLTSSMVTFTWSPGTAVAAYKLTIGTTLGGTNIYNGSPIASTSATVSTLPTAGQLLYVRLWSLIGTTWQKKDYTYRAVQTEDSPAAEITSPVKGSTFTSTTVNFSWTAGMGAGEYWLSIGSSAGAKDLHDHSIGTSRSHTVTGLPSDNRTLYVRLSTKCYGVWEYRDYTYKAKKP